MKTRIRIQGTLIFIGITSVIFFWKYLFPNWESPIYDHITDSTGFFFLLLGFVFRIASRGYKMDHSSQSHLLVTGGPYQLTQNPMYVGTFFIGTGVTLILFKIELLLLFFAVYLCIYIPQIKREKIYLTEHFGGMYQDYCKKSSIFLPSLKGWLNLNKYVSLKWDWIKKELPSFLWTISFVIIVDVLQNMYLFGSTVIYKEIFDIFLIIFCVVGLFFIFFKSAPSQQQVQLK